MGIEDQSTQSYRAIGQPSSAPQSFPIQQGLQGLGQMGGQQLPPGIDSSAAQDSAWMKGFQQYQQQQQNIQQPQIGMRDQMPYIREALSPWASQRPQQQDMYKPQFGAYASSLHQIADQLQQADSGGNGQIGKFGDGSQSMWAKPNMPQQGQMAWRNPFDQNEFKATYKEGGDVNSGLASAAQQLASKGRNGDTELLHVTKDEIEGLLAIAREHGIHMTRNPHTGLYEASWLSKGLKKVGSAVKSVAKVVTAPVTAVAKAVKDTVGPIVTKVRDLTQTGLNAMTLGATKSLTSKGAQENFQKIKDKVGPVFTKLRDVAESAAVLAGNYFVPGSSMLTSMLASKGAQSQLNSGIGQALMAATGGLAGAGGGLSALKSGLTGALKNGLSGLGASAMSGLKSLGTNALNGLKNIASQGLGAVKTFIANPAEGLKALAGKGIDFAKDKLSDLGMDKITDWAADKLGGVAEGAGDLVEGAGNALQDFLSGQGGEAGAGGSDGSGGGTGGRNPNDLVSILGSLYAAKHPFEDPREKAGLTNLPKPQFKNTQLKQVPNPNYGKPGEPYFISQEFTPAQTADTPVQAAGGGLMNTNGYFIGGNVPSYAGGGNIYEYNAGGKLLDGPGDGMSDSIPAEIRGKKVQKALLADGEFVIPADVVSGLGNGSTKAGSKVLYSMMDRVREARTGTTEQGKQIDPNKFVPA